MTTHLTFQAYIPKSLGKTLESYFQNNPHFNEKGLQNFKEFKKFLQQKDSKGYKWIKEPVIGEFLNSFFATDDIDFHESHSKHTARLSIEGKIDCSKAGYFTNRDINQIFSDACDGKLRYNYQHSSESHRVVAYITHANYIDTGSTFVPIGDYKAIFKSSPSIVSYESPLRITFENTTSNHYLWAKGSQKKIFDTTIIEVSASAGYPYLEPTSPNIDFKLKIRIQKVGGRTELRVEGTHDMFPAYELIIDGKVMYRYNPKDYGHTGPNPFNLHSPKTFSVICF